jgi:heparan-alpha-glucosaminide N-acetyltransferase
MKRSLNHRWIFYITIQLILHYGQTQIIETISSDPLEMDQALLTINNKNYPDPISIRYNVIVCEHCDFVKLSDSPTINSSKSLPIDTKYPYDFQVFTEIKNKTLVCQIESYKFSEHGSYSFDIIQINQNESSCKIYLTNDSSYYWTPIICAILFLCCFILIIQLCHNFYNSRYVGRILTNIGHQRLINNETDVTPAIGPTANRREPALIANEAHNENMFDAETTNNELPLVGSTRSSNNSIKITKILPKRLRALDTFRGFALMIMIFVNYGGENLSSICLFFFF